MSIADNVSQVRERMSQAASRAGRSPDSITLMAVSKVVEPARIRQAYEAGIRVFGENRVQEFADKTSPLQDLTQAEWHLIGHLQTNKAKKAVEIFHAVDSVDSLRLAQKIDQAAKQLSKTVSVLIEINVGGEENKGGVPANSAELEELLQGVQQLSSIQ